MPTNDGLTLLVVGWPYAESRGLQGRRRGATTSRPSSSHPSSPTASRAATRASGSPAGRCPNFFRKPYGPGWALVGDAGYNKDPITAQGISDAFRDAERCSAALDDVVHAARARSTRRWPPTSAARDARVLPIYEFTTQLATLEAPPPEMQQLLGAVHGNQDAMDAFVSITAGTVSPVEFFDPANIGRIMRRPRQA